MITTIENIAKQVNTKLDWSSNRILGAKNLFPLLYRGGNGSGSTTNGTWQISNGQLTVDGQFSQGEYITATDTFLLRAGTYLLTYSPTNITAEFYDPTTGFDFYMSSGYSVTFDSDISVYPRFWANAESYSNVTFQFMLRLAADSDSTYQPYTMTNYQLTDTVTEKDLQWQITINTTYFDSSAIVGYWKISGNLKWFNFYSKPKTTLPSDTSFASGFTPNGIHKACLAVNPVTRETRMQWTWPKFFR